MSYEHLFVEQLKNFAVEGDVLLALSGSGNSPNVIRAVEYAKTAGCRTICYEWARWGQARSAGRFEHPYSGAAYGAD